MCSPSFFSLRHSQAFPPHRVVPPVKRVDRAPILAHSGRRRGGPPQSLPPSRGWHGEMLMFEFWYANELTSNLGCSSRKTHAGQVIIVSSVCLLNHDQSPSPARSHHARQIHLPSSSPTRVLLLLAGGSVPRSRHGLGRTLRNAARTTPGRVARCVPHPADRRQSGLAQAAPRHPPAAAVFADVQALLVLYTLAMGWAWLTRRWTATVLQARVHVPVLLLAALLIAAVGARVASLQSLVPRARQDLTPMLLAVLCVPSPSARLH